MQAEDLGAGAAAGSSALKRRGAARVADEPGAARHDLGRGRDLGVRHAQQDRLGAGGHLAAAGGLADLVAGLAQRGGDGEAEAAFAHDADPRQGDGRRRVEVGEVPFQFPHAEYRSVGCCELRWRLLLWSTPDTPVAACKHKIARRAAVYVTAVTPP